MNAPKPIVIGLIAAGVLLIGGGATAAGVVVNRNRSRWDGVQLPGPIVGQVTDGPFAGQPIIKHAGRPELGSWAGGTPGLIELYGDDRWILEPGSRGDEPDQVAGTIPNRNFSPEQLEQMARERAARIEAAEKRERQRQVFRKVWKGFKNVGVAVANFWTGGGASAVNEAGKAIKDARESSDGDEADDPQPLRDIRMGPTHLPGMLSRDEMLARYQQSTGQTIDEAAWWFMSMDRACQVQLLAKAAGTPLQWPAEAARGLGKGLGSPEFGWLSFQTILG